MNKVSFSNIFKGNFLRYVTKYKENIQMVLREYDVVIFMARKAICFYESMVANGEIKKTNCEVFSSRILDYNVINRIKGKKIAIVDDVVVKGTSLNRVISIFDKENLKSFVLVVACEASFPDKLTQSDNFEICNSYVTLNQADIYSFAGMITEYIEASMCSFNIDQPIYTITNLPKQSLNKLFVDYNAIDITSGLQQIYEIENKVIYFRNSAYNNESAILRLIPDDTIIKIRVLSNKFKTIVIPFVLFPQLTNEELDNLYVLIRSKYLDDFVCVNNTNIAKENKMKVVSYYFSEVLAEAFCKSQKIEYEKSFDNDIFHFSIESKLLFGSKIKELNLEHEALCITKESSYSYSKFLFSNVIGLCYNSIINFNNNNSYFDSNNKLIDEIIITHCYFKNKIAEIYDRPELLASSVVDVFIDHGMMVPAIVHTDLGIVRAYKMGEYSKLTRSQIESFAAMLYQYQDMIDSELGKTELEKLCVLFFNAAINRGIFPQQAHYEDDCYSIGYSLFGPRVSFSNSIYNASTDSVLVTDFCKERQGKSIVIYENGKYTINPISTSPRMSQFALGFAHPYAAVSKLFNTKADNENNSVKWNMFVHTYVQYLTLRAIGNNKRNQYLSLCAELYQLTKLKDDFFELKSKEKKECEWILKGINSGLWKYWCFKNDALYKTSMLIFKKNPDVGSWLLSDVEPAFDEAKNWDGYIENAAHLLYKAAFLINEVLKAKNSLKHFNTGDDICDNPDNQAFSRKTMFTIGSYYAEFEETRHCYENSVSNCVQSKQMQLNDWARNKLMEIKNAARKQLDLCDRVLESATTKYSSIQKLLVVYSSSKDFPINLSDGLNELYLEGIDQGDFCRVFGLSFKKSNLVDLTDLLDRINLYSNEYDLKYFVLDVGSEDTIDYIENKVKDSRIAKLLNCTIRSFLQRQNSKKPELVLVGPKAFTSSFDHGNHHFALSDDYINQVIEDNLRKLPGYLAEKPMSVNVYIIESPLYLEGEHAMKIGQVGSIESIVEQNGDNSTNTIVRGNYTTIPDGMIDLLKELNNQIDVSEKIHIEEAIASAKNGDTNKFVKAMKSLGKHTLSIIENIAASVLYEWLHQNGIL